jgi:type IV secretory pathway VirB2 component (pilin)
MKEQKNKALVRVVQGVTLAYRYLLGFFSVAFLAGLTSSVSSSFAATEGFGSFNAYVCSIVTVTGQIVGGLAVVMIIAAGIMYAASGGNDKGDLSVSSAKSMITSALSGIALYLLGGALLGQCGGSGYGELINRILGR